MSMTQNYKPVNEHDELIDMRTHLTVALLAAAQLRRTMKDLPEAARFDAYLDQALDSLVEDVRKVDTLVAQTEALASIPDRRATQPVRGDQVRRGLIFRLAGVPVALARHTAGSCCRWAQRHGFTRLTALPLYD
jgi:hypothetical protein